jgi:hypothetical protein
MNVFDRPCGVVDKVCGSRTGFKALELASEGVWGSNTRQTSSIGMEIANVGELWLFVNLNDANRSLSKNGDY